MTVLNFSEYLRQQRLASGLTMQELAERLQVSPQFISLLENGKRHPSDKLVQRTARVFDEDLNYLRFLAQPIPDAQKKALFESPSAPDYLPQSMRSNLLVQDSDDVLIETFLAVPALPKPEEDTPYHFGKEVDVDPADLRFAYDLIAQIRENADRFPAKIRAWADFYDYYYKRHLESRKAAQSILQELDAWLRTETGESYPLKLRYLTALHLGMVAQEQGDLEEAKARYNEANERAAAMPDPGHQATALWQLASVYRDEGDLISMLETLQKALQIEDIPAFGIARCQSDAVDALLALWENEAVIEHAEDCIKLWRSSSLKADQAHKSLNLIRMEISAFEASLRLEQEEEARGWLSRVRSMRVRITLPPLEEAHLAVTAGALLTYRQRYTQAQKHFREVLELPLPDTDMGHFLLTKAQLYLAHIAVQENRLSDAETFLSEADIGPSLKTTVRELERKVLLALGWAEFFAAQGKTEKSRGLLDTAEQELRDAIQADARLEESNLVSHYTAEIRERREKLAE